MNATPFRYSIKFLLFVMLLVGGVAWWFAPYEIETRLRRDRCVRYKVRRTLSGTLIHYQSVFVDDGGETFQIERHGRKACIYRDEFGHLTPEGDRLNREISSIHWRRNQGWREAARRKGESF